MSSTTASERSQVLSRVVDSGVPAGSTRVGVITLARPDKKNALTLAMLTRLHALFTSADKGWAARCGALVLEGDGEALCAGFDLSSCREDMSALGGLLNGLASVIGVMRASAQPIVIAAHGAALAGGCAMVCAGDVVVTNAAAKFGYPVVRLGISPAVSGPVLAQAAGFGHARQRMLASELISGQEAFRIGLAHECVDEAGRVRAEALDLALALASKPRAAMTVTKRWLGELDGSDDLDRMSRALDVSIGLAGSSEQQERLAAIWGAGR